jgi:cytidine deaminase
LSDPTTSLIDEAREAMKHAHAPYSNFPVGAALRTKSGKVYRGANVENASLGLSVCAERVAVWKAVSSGSKDFDAIAIVTDAETPTPPCGACRQILLEFVDDLDVHISARGRTTTTHLAALLPNAFKTYVSND